MVGGIAAPMNNLTKRRFHNRIFNPISTMKRIYDSDFLSITYDDATDLIECRWQNSDNMTEDEFRQEMLNYNTVIEEHRPKRMLVHNLYFTITPDLQEWINETVDPVRREVGLTKSAYIVSENIISNISVEQFADDSNELSAGSLENRMFNDRDEATAWLLS